MICVVIARGRHRHLIAEHKHLVEQGAQLVELRLDFIQGAVNLKRILDGRPSPVVITCRREVDGGRFTGPESQRLLLLRQAIADGVEYVDLEEDIADKIPRYGKTKRIISYHDFRKTPDDLAAIHERMTKLDPDIVKLATLANHPEDNLRMLELMRSAKVPTVGICMGDIGTPSRILTGKFGAPFTYATFHHERTLAPGQLSFEQMTQIYHYDEINAETEIFGVIGDPIGHSHSPLIHNAAFRQLGMNKVYVPFRVPREDLNKFLDDAARYQIKGLSVTIPHKNAAMHKVAKVDNAAHRVGALNTVVFGPDGAVGYNTDYRAAMEALEATLNVDKDAEQPLRGRTALVLGAGGASQAICHGLKRRGAEVLIANRTREKADKLAEAVGGQAIDWDQRHNPSIDILINCTPIGMHPNVDQTPFENYYLKPHMVVFDTVYNPENTLLIKEAKNRMCMIVTGVEMFVRQAAMQFTLFTGQTAPIDLMRETLKRATGAAKG